MPKNLQEWLQLYGESHQNRTNILIHKICVPVIFVSLYMLLFSIPVPYRSLYLNISNIIYLGALIFWFRLSWKIGFAFLIFGFILALTTFLFWLFPCRAMDHVLARTAAIAFALGWVGQFFGHKIEGKKPSFLDDLKFLLIGPIWIFSPINKNK